MGRALGKEENREGWGGQSESTKASSVSKPWQGARRKSMLKVCKGQLYFHIMLSLPLKFPKTSVQALSCVIYFLSQGLLAVMQKPWTECTPANTGRQAK